MKDDMIKLLNAQDYDLEVDTLRRSKNEFPKRIEQLKKEIADLDMAIESKKARIKEIEVSRGSIETDIAAERDTLARKEKRLLETTTNKEYTAVHNEIEIARQRIDNLETEDLQLMEEADTLNPEIEELEKNADEVKQKNGEEIADLEARFNSIESDIAVLNDKVTRELTGVNPRALGIYHRLRKSKSGRAVAPIDKQKLSCTGCFKQLPPQKVLEVRRYNKILICESCGRILAWDPRNEDEA